jgi:hypothetical protein
MRRGTREAGTRAPPGYRYGEMLVFEPSELESAKASTGGTPDAG